MSRVQRKAHATIMLAFAFTLVACGNAPQAAPQPHDSTAALVAYFDPKEKTVDVADPQVVTLVIVNRSRSPQRIEEVPLASAQLALDVTSDAAAVPQLPPPTPTMDLRPRMLAPDEAVRFALRLAFASPLGPGVYRIRAKQFPDTVTTLTVAAHR
jgi:hypothetical protein